MDSADTTQLSLSESSRTRAFIGFGSNVGDRYNYIGRALDELRTESRIWIESISSIYQTAPVGLLDQPDFLNGVVRVKTGVFPLDLLKILKRIEAQVGRQHRQRWGPREIDLDILIYGSLVLDHPQLTIPHPEMVHRQFVLKPLVEIQPDLIHPRRNQTVHKLLHHLVMEAKMVCCSEKQPQATNS